jgi:uncharacterized membrane protein YgaE (UPF0421/DUF939 family)
MTTQQWINTAIKTIISLVIAVAAASAIGAFIVWCCGPNLAFIGCIIGIIIFICLGYKLLPRATKDGIKNW